MFQSSEDISFDEEFLNDTFDIPSTVSTNNIHYSGHVVAQSDTIITDTYEKKKQNILSIINRQEKLPRYAVNSAKTILTRTLSPDKQRRDVINSILKRPLLSDRPRRVVTRKFPGPAGILPPENQLNMDLKLLDSTITDQKTALNEEIVFSQNTDDLFNKGPWNRMLKDLCDPEPSFRIPEQYTIAWIKSRARCQQFVGKKSPFLAAVIESIDSRTKDPMLVLKDPTGEMPATLLCDVWHAYSDILISGSVLVLREIAVLSINKRHYLTITLNNIVTIYSEPPDSVSGTHIQYMSGSDLTTTLSEFKSALNGPSNRNPELANGYLKSNPIFPQKTSNSTPQTELIPKLEQQSNISLLSNCKTVKKKLNPYFQTYSDFPAINSNLDSEDEITVKSPKKSLFSDCKTAQKCIHSNLDNPNLYLKPNASFKNPNFELKMNFPRNLQEKSALKLVFPTRDSHNAVGACIPTPSQESRNMSFLCPIDNASETSQNSEILSQVFEGINSDSIFDDF